MLCVCKCMYSMLVSYTSVDIRSAIEFSAKSYVRGATHLLLSPQPWPMFPLSLTMYALKQPRPKSSS